MYVVRYSFNFRYTTNKLRTVDVPIDHLVGLELNEYMIRDVVRTTPELNDELLGDQAEYVRRCTQLEDWKSLERRYESFEIVRK